MAGATSTFYTARFLLPDYIVRGQENVLSCPVYRDGALVTPASGTGTVYNSTNTVVHSQTVSITGGIASITIPALTLPSTLSLESGWRVEWALIIDGVSHPIKNKAHLVRSELYPVVTDADLFRRVSSLNPAGSAPISSLTDFQDYLDEAWVVIVGRISGQGPLPYLIMEPTALREPHLLLTLALIFEDFETRLTEQYTEKAATYRERYEASFSTLKFEYDSDQDGRSDGPRKRAGMSTIWLTGRY